MKIYYCEDCFACEQRVGSTKDFCCRFDKTTSGLGKTLQFDVKTKNPCDRFIPADYIEAINFDIRP
jgi:hypothetical protein